MEFCGRCGHELGRGIERGRFCPQCGHENPGNARYPLYADGTPALTRPRPATVSPSAAEMTVVRPAPALAAHARSTSAAAAASAPVGPVTSAPGVLPADVTRRRVRTVDDAQAGAAQASSSWQVTLVATLVAMLVVAVLGFMLLLH